MKRTLRLTGLSALLVGFLLSAGVGAADLKIDGKVYLPSKLINDPLQIDITGNPGMPVTLLADLSEGPTFAFGQSLPLGFSPAFIMAGLPPIPAGGTLSFAVTIPPLPTLHDITIYMLAAVHDPGFPSGLDFSNGAKLTMKDRNIQLAGISLAQYPHFQYVRAFNARDPIEFAIDPNMYPSIVGKSADVYIVDSKNKAQWLANPTLVDKSSTGATPFTFAAGTIQGNSAMIDAGFLSWVTGDENVGVGYDVVIDFNKNGVLDGTDLIDGYGDEAGFYVMDDFKAAGPLAVTELIYNVGISFGGQDLYYPSSVASMGQLPLVIISHGNGHNYTWYDHIGYHLASYGYVVMSHQNNTGPGTASAATTTLTNTEAFLSQLGSIAGGALLGHVDKSRTTWIGHSRGGEGICRAYDDIFEGTYNPTNFSLSDLKLLSSIAPTDFAGPSQTNPHTVNYHLWVGQSDSDVNGCASNDIAQPYHLHDRAQQARQSISLYGVGHGDFHAGGGSSWATGPNLIGRAATHTIMLPYLLALVEHHIDGSIPMKDYLWRQYEAIHAKGAPASSSSVIANMTFRENDASGKFVIDDFQTQTSTGTSSSGGLVTNSVLNISEGLLNDINSTFTHVPSDTFNGFTYCRPNDSSRGMILEYSGDSFVQFRLAGADTDISSYAYFSFKAAQSTRHPKTTSHFGDTTFDVELRDGQGHVAVINIGAYGGGIEEPYQRTSCGTGAGWNSEFETIRIRLSDFTTNGTNLDLTDVRTVTFLFGPSHGTSQGRIGFDDLELTTD